MDGRDIYDLVRQVRQKELDCSYGWDLYYTYLCKAFMDSEKPLYESAEEILKDVC